MQQHRIFSRALVGLLAAFSLMSCNTQKTAAPPVNALVPVSLRLKWLYDPGFAGELIAAHDGYFAKSGLDITIKSGGFESDPIKLVASGSDTFGVTGADSFLLARSHGVPIVAIAGGYLVTPVVFYVHADSGINSPTNFVGRRVGYQAGQDTATVYESLMDKMQVPRGKIVEVPVKYDFTPFLTKRVDVWPGYAATQSYILHGTHTPFKTIEPADYGISYLGTVYFTSEAYVARHPERVQAFVNAVIRGWHATYADEDAAARTISSYDPQNLSLGYSRFALDRQRRYVLPFGGRFCDFPPKSWENLNLTLVHTGLLGKPIDIAKAVDYRFLHKYYADTN